MRLLIVGGTAQIKHNLWILVEELFDDADDRLWDFLVVGRLGVLWIGKVEPIGRLVWIAVQLEVHMVLDVVVRHEHILLVLVVNVVGRPLVDGFSVKSVHNLYPFKVVVSRVGSGFFVLLPCLPLGFHLALESLLTVSCLLQPGEDFLAGARLVSCRCLHNS